MQDDCFKCLQNENVSMVIVFFKRIIDQEIWVEHFVNRQRETILFSSPFRTAYIVLWQSLARLQWEALNRTWKWGPPVNLGLGQAACQVNYSFIYSQLISPVSVCLSCLFFFCLCMPLGQFLTLTTAWTSPYTFLGKAFQKSSTIVSFPGQSESDWLKLSQLASCLWQDLNFWSLV